MGDAYRVIRVHRPEQKNSREIESGERLKFERRPTQWEGWLWCEAPDGYRAWVPENWVTITREPGAVSGDGAGWCFMKRDYDDHELTVDPGEQVTGEVEESGWLLARTDRGEKGWIPIEAVEKT